MHLQEEKERQRLESLRAARQKQAGSAASRPLMIRTGKARTEGAPGWGLQGAAVSPASCHYGAAHLQMCVPADPSHPKRPAIPRLAHNTPLCLAPLPQTACASS